MEIAVDHHLHLSPFLFLSFVSSAATYLKSFSSLPHFCYSLSFFLLDSAMSAASLYQPASLISCVFTTR